jgi:hypothetical protein
LDRLDEVVRIVNLLIRHGIVLGYRRSVKET